MKSFGPPKIQIPYSYQRYIVGFFSKIERNSDRRNQVAFEFFNNPWKIALTSITPQKFRSKKQTTIEFFKNLTKADNWFPVMCFFFAFFSVFSRESDSVVKRWFRAGFLQCGKLCYNKHCTAIKVHLFSIVEDRNLARWIWTCFLAEMR